MSLALGVLAFPVSAPARVFAQRPASPRPVYGITGEDPVTADNRGRALSHPQASCGPDNPCYLPEPNPAPVEGLPVDSHTADTYERPTAPGSAATGVISAVDIASAQVGADEDRLYFRINLADVDERTRGLPYVYGFELDYDDEDAGDLLVRVTDPAGNLGTRFGVGGVAAFWNANSNVFGATAHLPDGPGGTIDGYEVLAFDQGANHVKDNPGGDRAVVARVAPDRAASVELAVARPFLEAVTTYDPRIDLGGPFTKLALRPNASTRMIDPAAFTLHDRFGRQESGSPYPFLRVAPESPTCPASDAGLTQAAREALDSGTDADTGIANPCYPNRALAEYDNAYYTVGTTDPTPTPGPPGGDQQAQRTGRGGTRWGLVLAVGVALASAVTLALALRRPDRS
ncbi:MAG: hypothetical protein CYG61_04680 [Actinobacteria bacterium]|nr:MAG: hypothetical protein CYG61_04680 [Actinomycetota bacterium]